MCVTDLKHKKKKLPQRLVLTKRNKATIRKALSKMNIDIETTAKLKYRHECPIMSGERSKKLERRAKRLSKKTTQG